MGPSHHESKLRRRTTGPTELCSNSDDKSGQLLVCKSPLTAWRPPFKPGVKQTPLAPPPAGPLHMGGPQVPLAQLRLFWRLASLCQSPLRRFLSRRWAGPHTPQPPREWLASCALRYVPPPRLWVLEHLFTSQRPPAPSSASVAMDLPLWTVHVNGTTVNHVVGAAGSPWAAPPGDAMVPPPSAGDSPVAWSVLLEHRPRPRGPWWTRRSWYHTRG